MTLLCLVLAQHHHRGQHQQAQGRRHGDGDVAVQRSVRRCRFRLGGLGSFLYTVKLEVPSRFAPVEPRAIGAGATGLTLVLLAAAEARVTVLDPAGEPVPGATVSVVEWVVKDERRRRHDRFIASAAC